MFDVIDERPLAVENSNILQQETCAPVPLPDLVEAISRLSDESLAELEDDLNFLIFAGLPSERILAVLAEVMPLKGDWLELHKLHAGSPIPRRF